MSTGQSSDPPSHHTTATTDDNDITATTDDNDITATTDDNDCLLKLLRDVMEGDIDSSICTGPDNDKPWWGRRCLPKTKFDVMIISSYGESHPQHVRVAEKLVPPDSTADRLVLAREELDHLQDLYKRNSDFHVVYCYPEHGAGLQMNREYYLQRIRTLMAESVHEKGYKGYSQTCIHTA